MNNYSLEKLTSPKPDWDFAFIFIQGMDNPIGYEPKHFKVRWVRAEELIIIEIPRIMDPTRPPSEAGMGPNGPIEARSAGLAILEAHVHIDQINAINFYTSLKEASAATPKSNTSKILTAEGESQITAKERLDLESSKTTAPEGAENGVNEIKSGKASKKSKDNPLKKAE